jgi:predicted DNA-binding transcriptional regulator YafY
MMKSKDLANKLIDLLREHPDGLHKNIIMRHLVIGSSPTFYRALSTIRALGNYKIRCSKCIYSIITEDGADEDAIKILPDDDELIALLTIQHIIAGMTSKTLTDVFSPLQKRLDKYLKIIVKHPAEWADKIKILDIHYRKIPPGIFVRLTEAIAREYVIKFCYTSSFGKETLRVVSPQQLVRYKDNWYLDAWCHENNALRIFSLDNIRDMKHANKQYFRPEEGTIHEIYATSYGIFSGKPMAIAKIRLTGLAARYAKREIWHPEQVLTDNKDGSVEIDLPYSKPHELLREILSWGNEAEILEPVSLREEINGKIRKMSHIYSIGNKTL